MEKGGIFKSILWTSFQKFGSIIISFIANIFLARLLTPDDFGTVGLLAFFVTLSQTIVDSGLGSALIQKKTLENNDASTVFVTNIAIAVVMYLFLFLIAPAVANYYNIPVLKPLLRVQGTIVLIHSFTVVQTALLTKTFSFKQLSSCNLTAACVSAFAGILLAYLGAGLWSLVYRTLIQAVVSCCMIWSVSRWKMSFHFSIESFKQLFSFGSYILFGTLFANVTNNVQALILGKHYSLSTVGHFTQANSLRNIASDGIASTVGQVMYPDFSSHQDDDSMLSSRVEKSSSLLSYAVSTVLFFAIVAAAPLIHLIYGQQWDEAIPYFRILCIGGIPLSLMDINISVIKAKGKSRLLFNFNWIKFLVLVPCLILVAKFCSIYAVLWLLCLYSLIIYVVCSYMACSLMKTSIKGQLYEVVKALLIPAVSGIIVAFLNYTVAVQNNIVCLLFDVIVYFLIIIVLSEWRGSAPYKYLCMNFKNLIFHSRVH